MNLIFVARGEVVNAPTYFGSVGEVAVDRARHARPCAASALERLVTSLPGWIVGLIFVSRPPAVGRVRENVAARAYWEGVHV